MAQLEDKINTTLDQVISTEWRGQGRGGVGGSLKKKSHGSGALKGQGRQIRRASKGGSKGGKAGGGKGKDSNMPRGPRAKGSVKKTLFSKRRGTTEASRIPLRVWSKGVGKGTVKGKSKGSGRRLAAKGKGKGKGKGKWSGSDFDESGTGGQRLWRGARSKGKGRGKGKDAPSKWQGSGEGRSDKWKGKGKGRLKGKGKSQPSDGYGVRRSIVKRQPGMRAGISEAGKGKGKGMSRAFAIATGGSLGRRGTWGKGTGKGREREERHERRRDGDVVGSLSADDERMMKKITIVAQLDKVPKPTPAMQGFSMGGRNRSERGGSLSRRFGANRER